MNPLSTRRSTEDMESALVDTALCPTPPHPTWSSPTFLSDSLWEQEYCCSVAASPSGFMLLPYLCPNTPLPPPPAPQMAGV